MANALKPEFAIVFRCVRQYLLSRGFSWQEDTPNKVSAVATMRLNTTKRNLLALPRNEPCRRCESNDRERDLLLLLNMAG